MPNCHAYTWLLFPSVDFFYIQQDNTTELFKRACKIFNVEPELLRIWDFSGQLTLYFMYDKSRLFTDYQKQWDQEILLELQVYGLSDMKSTNGKKDELPLGIANGSSCESGSLGLTGLQNLGNTCFMNSAVQCLAHTPKLVDYFLGDYNKEINHENPLGMDGEIALAFGDLIRKLWAPGSSPVAPRLFKSKLARFAPQFSGFNQHDSQELLAFLLDGLHEDLNRVKCKPYVEAKDGDNRRDEEVADEYWQNHIARNDSIIVDVCQGQYKSTLICPICKKVSVTFDPFMYLSLPLPSTTMRTMTLTVISSDGSAGPVPYTVTVPKSGRFSDLIQSLGNACSLGIDETLLVAEVYNNRIIRFLEDPADSLSLIRDGDRLIAYRLPSDAEKDQLIVFMHQRSDEHYIHGKVTPFWKAFGIPLLAMVRNNSSGSDICRTYLVLLRPFAISSQNGLTESKTIVTSADEENAEMEDAVNSCTDVAMDIDDNQKEIKSPSDTELQFYVTDEKGTLNDNKIVMNECIPETGSLSRCYVLVSWPERLIEQYDMQPLKLLPEVFKCSFLARKPPESVSLYKCLEAFLKEEPLGPEDMWYCPGCKEHRQASKKLDIWRLPEILVIHLKRFSYSRYTKNKLETYVDFPIDNLDLSSHIAYKNGGISTRYMLYAISNHYGSMGGGHYTAHVHHGGGRWYDFDDSRVSPISEDKIKSSAAYVLFYRRLADDI
uniref:Ubiquitin carboxyl-terminal hydrolase n=1 Tax=Kalanchoe fedtschenkoi TaxID=63787 RepID=A0A7N0V0Y7_KALFE